MKGLSVLGPVFWYELVTCSRRLRYFAIRGTYCSILLFLLWTHYREEESRREYSSISSRANLAADFFRTFSFTQITAVVLLTPALLATSIAQERERRTIEYLFASQLSNAEIVFGKVAARLVQATVLLLAGLPVLAFTMLMGGIAPESLLLVFMSTVSSVVLVAGLSVGISTVSPRARDSVIRVYVILLALLALPPFFYEVLIWTGFGAGGPVPDLIQWLVQINPFVVLSAILSSPLLSTGPTPLETAGPAMAWQAVIGIASMGLAAAVVRRFHRWQAGKGAKPRRRRTRPSLEATGAANRPMLWKEIHQEGGLRLGFAGRLALWLVLLAMAGVEGWQIIRTSRYVGRPVRPWDTGVDYLVLFTSTVAGISAGLALLGVLVRAATSITSEKDRDCWLTLISSPMEGAEIVSGKSWGAVRSVRALAAFAAVSMGIPALYDPSFLGAFLLWCLTVVVVGAFLCAAGIRISMSAKSSLQAIVIAGVLVLVLGGGYFLCCMPFLLGGQSGDEAAQLFLAPCIPFLVAAPSIFWSDSRIDDELIVAFSLGLFGYGVAAAALFATNRSGFDALAGRAPSRAGGPGKMNPAPAATAPAKPPAAPAPGEEPPP